MPPVISAVGGMTPTEPPAWKPVTPTIAGSWGSTSRATMCCSAATTRAPIAMGRPRPAGRRCGRRGPESRCGTRRTRRRGPGQPSGARRTAPQVQPDEAVDAVHDARLDHPGRAARQRLLAGLEEEADLAREVLAQPVSAVAARAGWRCGRRAAGVHHAGVLRCERQPGVLLDGQRVHVGADRERRAGPPADEARDDAGARRARHLEAESGELLGDEARRLGLLEGQLRVRVQMPAPRDDVRVASSAADRRSLP